MKIQLLVMAACMAGSAVPGYSHHAWVAKDSAGFKVVYGHEKLQGFEPAKVKDATAFDAKGKKLDLTVSRKDSSAALEAKGTPAWFLVHFDNGYWTKTTEGSKNVSKKGIPEYLSSSHSVKYSKSVFAWGDKLLKPMGQKMEIVPAARPAAGADSVLFGVTVFFEGKPASGVPVSAGSGHDAKDTTDAKGMAEVKVSAKGPNLIVASRKIPLSGNPDADTLSISGALFLDIRP